MAPGGRSRSRNTIDVHQSVENLPSGDVARTSDPSLPRKGRGKAKNIALSKIIAATGAKIRTYILPGRTRALGKIGDYFAREIGIITRTHIPLSCRNWKSVKKPQREILYARVMEKFEIDTSKEHVVRALNSYMGRRFKDFRSELHDEYKLLQGTLLQKKERPPAQISKEDWGSMCDWFETSAFKKLSEQNSTNREKNVAIHRGGSKPFISYRDEQRDAVTQEPMSRVELYRITHWTSQKGWTSQITENNYIKMLQLQAQPVQEGSIRISDDEIVDQVLGTRPGYIVGLGYGVVPLSSTSCTSSPNEEMMSDLARKADQAEKRAEEAERRAVDAEKHRADAEKRSADVASQLAGQQLKIDELFAKMGNLAQI